MSAPVARPRRRALLAVFATLSAAALATGCGLSAAASGEARAIPAFAPAAEATPTGRAATRPADHEVAVLAGGCFWGVQGVFQHVKGVTNAVSGYAGGDARTAEYEVVSTGRTGHAESVEVTFDPKVISYAKLLQVYFSVAHDPTQLDRQGPDSGTQYRSALFPLDDAQARTAQAYIAQLDQAKVFPAPIVTRIEPGHRFYPAEGYHQDFLARNPTYPYIVYNDLPKVEALKRLFPDLYRADPVLVGGAQKPVAGR
jgi:peptide-methionine (S)-S-oxide reductase